MSSSIRDYYATPDGERVARLLARLAAPAVRRGATARLLAVGHAGPLLTGLDPQQFERIALVTHGEDQPFPPDALNFAVEAQPEALPFAESMFDQALLVHALEFAERPRAMLRASCGASLAPASELILIVPNRAGVWTHFEATPFGQGRPWGRNELMRLLAEAMFEPLSWTSAMVAPPVRGLRWLDRPLTWAVPRLGGVHLVLARKTDGLAPIATGGKRAIRLAEA